MQFGYNKYVSFVSVLLLFLFIRTMASSTIIDEDFESGWNGWELYVDYNATAEAYILDDATSGKVLHTFISNTGSENWHVHVRKDGFRIENGKTYNVSLALKAETGFERNVEVRVEKATAPYTNYSAIPPFKISDTFKTYSFNFTMEQESDPSAGFCIELGYFPEDSDPIDIIVDNVSIVEVSNPVPIVKITSPVDGLITNVNPISVEWTVDGINQTTELIENLVEGYNKVVRSFTDNQGQTGKDSVDVTLDTQAPFVEIILPLNGYMTNDTEIDVTWSVDGVVQQTQTTELLEEGENTITRTAVDAAGNVGNTSIVVLLDTQEPIVQITSPVDGLITNKTPIAVSWTVDGVAQTAELSEALVEGVNTITRSFTDGVGNIGSASINVTLDTQAPVVAITSPVEGLITNQTPVSVTWTVDGVEQTTELSQALIEGENTIIRSFTDAAGNVGTTSISVTLDTEAPIVAITSPVDGLITNETPVSIIWTVDGVVQTTELSADLVEGVNTITRNFTDAAGNVGTASINVTLDTQTPVVAITSPVNGLITNDTPVAVSWSVDGVVQTNKLSEALVEGENTITRSFTDAAGNIGNASINVTLDTQAPVVVITSPIDGLITNETPIALSWTVDGAVQTTELSEALVEGDNVITRTFIDAAGNVGTSSVTVSLDTQAPVIAITSPVDGLITNQNPVSVSWTVDGVVQTVELSEDLIEGENTITRSFTDAAGNIGTTSISVTLDTEAPVVQITSPLEGLITNQSPVSVTWIVDGVAQSTELSEDLVEGENTITRSFTDAAGNIGTASVNVTLDTQAPVVTITSPSEGLITNQNPVSVSWTVDGVVQTTELSEDLTEGDNVITRTFTDAAGNVGTSSINVTLDTQAPAVEITSPVDGYITNATPVTISWTVDGVVQTTELSADLVEGENTISRSFTDAAGNVGSVSISLTLDTEAPVVVITSPEDGFITNTTPVIVAWTVDGVTQTTDLSADLVEGTNTITRSFTDAAGNVGTSSITVTLQSAAPTVEIIEPVNGSVFPDLNVNVVWNINGVVQQEQTEEVFVQLGKYSIIREVLGADSTSYADTVSVYVGVDTLLSQQNVTLDSFSVDLDLKNIYLESSILNINGEHEFKSILGNNSLIMVDSTIKVEDFILDSNTILSHFPTDTVNEYALDLCARHVELKNGSRIDVSGRGYWGDRNTNGWCGARTFGNEIAHSVSSYEYKGQVGGSYGSQGDNPDSTLEVPGEIYGNKYYPFELGSGGGCNRNTSSFYGGNGGGRVKITSQTLSMNSNATILANGLSGGSEGSSGSGGAVLLICDTIKGESVKIYAQDWIGGYAGGGRVAIYSKDNLPSNFKVRTASKAPAGSFYFEKLENDITIAEKVSNFVGIAPFTTEIIVDGWSTESAIAKYKIDWNKDGVWDSVATAPFVYTVACINSGSYPFRLEIEDVNGGTVSEDFLVVAEDSISEFDLSLVDYDNIGSKNSHLSHGVGFSNDNNNIDSFHVYDKFSTDSLILKINGNSSNPNMLNSFIERVYSGTNVLHCKLFAQDSIIHRGLEYKINKNLEFEQNSHSIVYPYNYIEQFGNENSIWSTFEDYQQYIHSVEDLGLDTSYLGKNCIGFSYDEMLNTTRPLIWEYPLNSAYDFVKFGLHFNNYNTKAATYEIGRLTIQGVDEDSNWIDLKSINYKDGMVDYRYIDIDLSRYLKDIVKLRFIVSEVYDDHDHLHKTGCYIGKLTFSKAEREPEDIYSIVFQNEKSINLSVAMSPGAQYVAFDTLFKDLNLNALLPVYHGDYISITSPQSQFVTNNNIVQIQYDSSTSNVAIDSSFGDGDINHLQSFTDIHGNIVFDNVYGVVDLTPPVIVPVLPTEGDTVYTSNGYAKIKYKVDNEVYILDTTLVEGVNSVTLSASDAAGNSSSVSLNVVVVIQEITNNEYVKIESPTYICNTFTPTLLTSFSSDTNLVLAQAVFLLNNTDISNLMVFDTTSASYAFDNENKLDRGEHVFSVKVPDVWGDIHSDTLEFHVNAPIAKGTVSDTLGEAPLTVYFNSNAEYPGKDIDWFRWDIDSDGSIEYSSQKQNRIQHTYNEPGTYYAKFVVICSDGLSDTNIIKITVVEPTPNPPTAFLDVTKKTGLSPLQTRFYGGGYKKDGYIKRHEWDLDEDGVFEISYLVEKDTVTIYNEDFEEDLVNWQFNNVGESRFTHTTIENPWITSDSTWVTNLISTSDGYQKLETKTFLYEYLKSCSLLVGSHGNEPWIFYRIKGYPDSSINNYDKNLTCKYTKQSAVKSIDTTKINTQSDLLYFSIATNRSMGFDLGYIDSVLLWHGHDTIINEGAKSYGPESLIAESNQWFRTSRKPKLAQTNSGWLSVDSLNITYNNNANCEAISPVISIPQDVNNVRCSLYTKYELCENDTFSLHIIENGISLDTIFERFLVNHSEISLKENFDFTNYKGKNIQLKFVFKSDTASVSQGASIDNIKIYTITEPEIKKEKNYVSEIQCRDFIKGGDSTVWTRPNSNNFLITNQNGGPGTVKTWIESDFVKLNEMSNIVRVTYSKPRRSGLDVDNYKVFLQASTNGINFLNISELYTKYIGSGDPLNKLFGEDIEIPEFYAGDSVKFRIHLETNDDDTTDLYYFYLYDRFVFYSNDLPSYAEKTFSSVGAHSFSGFRVVDNQGLMDTATANVTVLENLPPFDITLHWDENMQYTAPHELRFDLIWTNGTKKIHKILWNLDTLFEISGTDSFVYSSNDSLEHILRTVSYREGQSKYNADGKLHYYNDYKVGGDYKPTFIVVDDSGDSTEYELDLHIEDTTSFVSYCVSSYNGIWGRNSLTFTPDLSESAIIGLRVKDSVFLRVNIEDSHGNVKRTLVDSVEFSMGKLIHRYHVPERPEFHGSDTLQWDGKDSLGNIVPEGAYCIVIDYLKDGVWERVKHNIGGKFLDGNAKFIQNDVLQNRISPLRNLQGYAIVDVPYTMYLEIIVGSVDRGERLRTLQEPKIVSAGRHKYFWDGFTSQGSIVNNMPWFDQDTRFVIGQSAFTVDDNVIYVKRPAPEISNIQISPVEFFPFNETYDSTGNSNDITVSYSLSQPAQEVLCEIIDTKTSLVIWKSRWEDVSTGSHYFKWSGKDKLGNYMDDGAYRVRLKAKTGYSESMWRYGILHVVFNYHEAK